MPFLSFVKTYLGYDFIDEGFSPILQTIEHLQPHPNPALDRMPCFIVPHNYANDDTLFVVLPYFGEHFDKDGSSLWYAQYRFPKEFT
ncbi:hypothetical protein A6R68_08234 [Neotoma lepida]|uniref:EF-1-gamma C-terminal domain-containing protein n=1 Tax=Neotoma lepida TaxID=56216 RepID=A0A1A6G332_NEOLE|nr:hypothetical protein A6R68_08234 [Neotoma lepida]